MDRIAGVDDTRRRGSDREINHWRANEGPARANLRRRIASNALLRARQNIHDDQNMGG